jgi:hypothetical protein
LVEKAKESTEKSKLLKKNCDEISFAKENYTLILVVFTLDIQLNPLSHSIH